MAFIIHEKYTLVKTPYCYGVLLVGAFVVGLVVDFGDFGFVWVFIDVSLSTIGTSAFISISRSLRESIKTSDISPRTITPQNPSITLNKCPLNICVL